MLNLTNKHIVITGASSGIGRSCAIHCAQAGASLLLMGRNEVELENTKQLLVDPSKARTLAIDLTLYEEVPRALENALDQWGPIDGIIHAAGISITLPFRNVSTDKMQHFYNVNVVAALHLTQQLLKPSRANAAGMSIVFLTSVMATSGESAKTLYSMTKGALLAAARSLAIELAPKQIRVNCIAPGVVVTPMTENAYYSQNPALKERVVSLHPLGLGKPEDVANACMFLLSDGARWITGTQLMVDGGYSAR